MKAYTQGEIDYFCGVYAIINACRYMMRKERRFSYKDGCLFYQHMMEYLIDHEHIQEVLHHGTDYDLIMEFLAEAQKYVLKTFDYELSYSRPYAGTEKPLEEVTEEIGQYLKNDKTAYIIRLSNKEIGDHWSVVIEKTPRNKFKLFDSYAYPAFDLKKSVWIPENVKAKITDENPTGAPQPPKNVTYVVKHGLIKLGL